MKANINEITIPEQVVFGKVIEGLRNHQAMTQTALAAAAGISNAALSRLERGGSNPSFTTLVGLARGLDLTPHRLMKAFDLAMAGAVKQLEEVTSGDLSPGAGSYFISGSIGSGKSSKPSRADETKKLVAAHMKRPGLLSMALSSVIGSGVFGALAMFVSEDEDWKVEQPRKT